MNFNILRRLTSLEKILILSRKFFNSVSNIHLTAVLVIFSDKNVFLVDLNIILMKKGLDRVEAHRIVYRAQFKPIFLKRISNWCYATADVETANDRRQITKITAMDQIVGEAFHLRFEGHQSPNWSSELEFDETKIIGTLLCLKLCQILNPENMCKNLYWRREIE